MRLRHPTPVVGGQAICGDLYALQDDLDFIKVQLSHLPTRNEVWRAAMLGMLGGAVAAVTLRAWRARAASSSAQSSTASVSNLSCRPSMQWVKAAMAVKAL